MKTVFSDSSQVAHIWANQSQDEAKNSNHTFYFHGRTIYSYGSHFPIAEISKEDSNLIFFTTRSYSPTTSKHISYVRRAIADYKKIVYVNNPRDIFAYSDNFWLEIATKRNDAIQSLKDAQLPKIRTNTRIAHKQSAVNSLQSIVNFLEIFGLTIETLKNKGVYKGSKGIEDKASFKYTVEIVKGRDSILNDEHDYLADFTKQKEKVEKAKQLRLKKQLALRLAEQQTKLAEWLKGGNIDTYELRDLPQIFLRAIPKNDATEVQTSQGARVSLKKAKVLYKAIKQGKDVLGFDIDGFTVVENNEIHLKVGCHYLLKTEINRFATTQGW